MVRRPRMPTKTSPCMNCHTDEKKLPINTLLYGVGAEKNGPGGEDSSPGPESDLLDRIGLDLADDVEDRAVARLEDRDNLILPLKIVGSADQRVRLLFQGLDRHVRDARIVEALDQIGTQGIDRDAVGTP